MMLYFSSTELTQNYCCLLLKILFPEYQNIQNEWPLFVLAYEYNLDIYICFRSCIEGRGEGG